MLGHLHMPHVPGHHGHNPSHPDTATPLPHSHNNDNDDDDDERSIISIAIALATSQLINIVESDAWEWEADPDSPSSRPMLRRSVNLMNTAEVGKKDHRFRWSFRSDLSEVDSGTASDRGEERGEGGRVDSGILAVPRKREVGARWSMASEMSEIEVEAETEEEAFKDNGVSTSVVHKHATAAVSGDEAKEGLLVTAEEEVEEEDELDDGLEWIVNSYFDTLPPSPPLDAQDDMKAEPDWRRTSVIEEDDAVTDLIEPHALKTLRQGMGRDMHGRETVKEEVRGVMLVRKGTVRPRDGYRCAAVIESSELE